MEVAKAVEAIKNHFDGEYFSITDTCSPHAIPDRAQKQTGEASEPFDHIFVDQDGGGQAGDDFHGHVYFAVEDQRYIVADF